MRKSVRRSPARLVYATAAIIPMVAGTSTAFAADSGASATAIASLRAGSNYSIETLRGQIGGDLLLVGPVSAVNVRSGSVELLGQSIRGFAERACTRDGADR